MRRLIARRLLVSVALVFIISLMTFVLQSAAPGDAARTILGDYQDPERYEYIREQLGLDDPVLVQYWRWLSQALRGDLGSSLISGIDVSHAITSRLPVTLSLMFTATMAVTLVGVGLGVIAAVRRGRLGRAIDVLSLVGHAVPNFWFALVLVTLFAVTIRLFPATGYVPLSASPGGWARSLVLPVTAIALPGAAVFAKHTRDQMLEVLSKDFVRALRANGASELSIVFRHGLRNAAIPVVTLIGLTFIGLFSGIVLIEAIFAMPGMGRLMITAATSRDLPTLQGVVVVVTLVVVAVNLVTDLVYGWLNPRVRVR